MDYTVRLFNLYYRTHGSTCQEESCVQWTGEIRFLRVFARGGRGYE